MDKIAPYFRPRDLPTAAGKNNLVTLPDLGSGQDSFFQDGISIDPLRWSGQYPYQLMIVEEQSSNPPKYIHRQTFTLPIPPQELNTQMPFAIVNSVTMGGVVEEHNGAPTRLIALSGTTGVLPLRSRGDIARSPTIFGGTIQSFNTTIAKATQLFSADPPKGLGVSDQGDEILQSSGYFQFRLLQRFLEYYAAIKKTQAGKKLRLAFANWKDEAVLLVTPLVFNVRRTVSSPLEYIFDLQLKAFRRISLDYSAPAIPSLPFTSRDPTILTTLLSKAMAAYSVVASAIDTVRAVRADLQSIMEIARQTIMSVKQIVNLGITLADLPGQIINDFQQIVIESAQSLVDAITGPDGLIEHAAWQNLLGQGVRRNTSGKSAPSLWDAIFKDPARYNDLLKLIPLDLLSNVDLALQARVQAELNRTAALTYKDFGRMLAVTTSAMTAIANSLGAWDANYNSTYDEVEPNNPRIPSVDDFAVLYALNDLIEVFNYLSIPPDDTRTPTLDYWDLLASSTNVTWTKPVSKFSVPFPYGSSLEQLALTYLGDPDRWIEIAALNDLREPLIDEVGWDIPLITNGKLQTLFVADATNLEIGQPVWIQSNSVNREKRHLIAIQQVGPGNIVLTLDGDADLDKYQVNDAAYLHVFLPNTINSQSTVFIPSQNIPGNQQDLKKVPRIDPFDPYLEVGGVDLLLKNDNDLVITPDGDGRMVYGMNNLIQWSRVALGTVQGSLIRHPNFGLPLKIGQSIADFSAKDLSVAARGLFTSDPAFKGVVSSMVSVQGPAVRLNLALSVVGQKTPLNLAVDILR